MIHKKNLLSLLRASLAIKGQLSILMRLIDLGIINIQ